MKYKEQSLWWKKRTLALLVMTVVLTILLTLTSRSITVLTAQNTTYKRLLDSHYVVFQTDKSVIDQIKNSNDGMIRLQFNNAE